MAALLLSIGTETSAAIVTALLIFALFDLTKIFVHQFQVSSFTHLSTLPVR